MKSHYVLSFESYFRDLVDATEVAVPDKVARYLPPVRAFLDDKKDSAATKIMCPGLREYFRQ